MSQMNICKFVPETTLDRLEINKFIYETDCSDDGFSFQLKYNRAILIKNGSVTININERVYTPQKGQLIFLFQEESVHIKGSGGCEYMYIDFGGKRSDTMLLRFGIEDKNRIFNNFDGLIPIWYDSVFRTSEKNIDLAAEGIILYTFSRLESVSNLSSDILNKIIRITDEEFSNCNLSISLIANKLNYNPKYLSHLFKSKMKMNYSEYLKTVRIKYAVSLLDHGIDSVKNVAYLSGFSDPLYFSNVFKKAIGVSPKDYTNQQNK